MVNDDYDLMLRIKEGDERAFRKLVEKYQSSILNLSYRYVGNQEDAEEVAEDVFIKVHQSAKSYEPRAKLSTYLYRITVNLSLNKIRDSKWKRLTSLEFFKRNEDDIAIHSGFDNPDLLLERKEKQEIIRRAVDSLPELQRTAVILQRFQGLSYEEIAEIMNCSVSAVEARIHRAKQNLQKRLKNLI